MSEPAYVLLGILCFSLVLGYLVLRYLDPELSRKNRVKTDLEIELMKQQFHAHTQPRPQWKKGDLEKVQTVVMMSAISRVEKTDTGMVLHLSCGGTYTLVGEGVMKSFCLALENGQTFYSFCANETQTKK